MTRAQKAWFAGTLAVVSVVALAWAALAAPEGYEALRSTKPKLAAAHARAAEAAFGQRVLLLEDRGDRTDGSVHESARSGAGWELFPATPPGERVLSARLAALGDRAAAEFSEDRLLTADTIASLAREGVALVQWVDADGARLPDVAFVAKLAIVGGSGVRLPGSEIVWRREGDAETPASILDPRDGLWGGSLSVDAAEPGTYRFAWPAAGARLTVNGDPATWTRATAGGYGVLDLPAGRTRVAASYVGDGSRGIVAILGGAGLAAAVLALMLLFRPQLEHDQAA